MQQTSALSPSCMELRQCQVLLHKLDDMYQVTELEEALPETLIKSVHVEVCQKSASTAPRDAIKKYVTSFLHSQRVSYGDVKLTEFDDPHLKEHVKWIAICDTELDSSGKKAVDLCRTRLHLHIFQLNRDGPALEELDGEEIAAASHWLLPAADFEGIWDNLVFDSDVKSNLLHYATATLIFSDHNVDPDVISWNRVILLHGPPGTGKTSLCKALAQKLCIRLSDRYSYGQLIEINSHSLFSKWFSESGKLVMKMFQKIQDLIDDQDAFVCVLIDEVESLTAARKSSLNGAEPSDAIRVVNALLTQIDQIKRYPNVLILTTSNITEAIDLAFVDRADIKQYIGPPSPAACFKIYYSCIEELIRAHIIRRSERLIDFRSLESMRFMESDATKLGLKLKEIAWKSQGLSGRTLRKLPFLAHALYLEMDYSQVNPVSLEDFLGALSQAVDKQFSERQSLQTGEQHPVPTTLANGVQ